MRVFKVAAAPWARLVTQALALLGLALIALVALWHRMGLGAASGAQLPAYGGGGGGGGEHVSAAFLRLVTGVAPEGHSWHVLRCSLSYPVADSYPDINMLPVYDFVFVLELKCGHAACAVSGFTGNFSKRQAGPFTVSSPLHLDPQGNHRADLDPAGGVGVQGLYLIRRTSGSGSISSSKSSSNGRRAAGVSYYYRLFYDRHAKAWSWPPDQRLTTLAYGMATNDTQEPQVTRYHPAAFTGQECAWSHSAAAPPPPVQPPPPRPPPRQSPPPQPPRYRRRRLPPSEPKTRAPPSGTTLPPSPP
ncbi:hypothetical protein HYH03_004003 [Edaphochlamys debaryana]|uniref:Uncharacterized protein n=1 Tax=Edaphochlamys debaryana TaxID=47281 RepID=A0A836C3X2_9CHLO|nr:hypothetical protein HYH03_004003 [Edaphochlamys debaryana]|eukprot:KAG2498253.1 hypothetical protein HYH03_004003 [Edaphochlamys debaryana]